MRILGKMVDERHINHRLRAGCFGGIAGYLVANILLLYRHFVDHAWSGDLITVAGAISVVTFGFMIWYLVND